jgi:hypothetical protein
MVKVDWLAVGVLLIPSSIRLALKKIKYASTEFANSYSKWEAGASCHE